MPKYGEDVKAKCVEAVKAGKSLASITKELGPNPKAIERYCKKAGVPMPKREKKVAAPKADKAAAPAKK